MIKRVKLVNFHGYGEKDNEIRFNPGLNVILGENATGKSTLIEAIWVSIFQRSDFFPRSLIPLITKYPKKNNFEIHFEFVGNDGITYTVVTKYEKNRRRDVKIFEDGTLIKESEREGFNLTNYQAEKGIPGFIAYKLGLPLSIIENIMIQRQEAGKALWPVESTATNLGKRLAKIFQLDRLQKLYKNTNRALGRVAKERDGLEKKVQELRGRIERDRIKEPSALQKNIEEILSEKEKVERARDHTKREIKKIDSELENIESKLDKLENSITELRVKRKDLDKITKEIEEIRKEIEVVEGRPKEISDKHEKERRRVAELESKVTNALSKRVSIQAELNYCLERQKELEIAIKETKNEIRDRISRISAKFPEVISLTEEEDEIKKAFVRFEEGIENVVSSIERNRAIISLIRKIKEEDRCPICDSNIESEEKKQKIQAKIPELEKRILELKRRKNELKKAKEVVDSLLKILDRIKDKMAEIKKLVEKSKQFKGELEVASGEYNKLKDALDKAQKELEILKRTIDYLDKVVEKEKIERELPELEGIEKVYGDLRRKKGELKAKGDELKAKEDEILEEWKKLSERLSELKTQLVISRDVYSQLKDAQERCKIIKNTCSDLHKAKESSKIVCFSFFKNNAEAISMKLGECWRALYTGEERSSALEKFEDAILDVKPREKDGELEYEISLKVLASDKKTYEDFRGFASAGQNVIGSIAFRMALLSTIGGRIFILDEPTIWVDGRRREYLSKVLRQVAEAIEMRVPIEQVILVTHDESLLQHITQYATVYRCFKNDEGYCAIKKE